MAEETKPKKPRINWRKSDDEIIIRELQNGLTPHLIWQKYFPDRPDRQVKDHVAYVNKKYDIKSLSSEYGKGGKCKSSFCISSFESFSNPVIRYVSFIFRVCISSVCCTFLILFEAAILDALLDDDTGASLRGSTPGPDDNTSNADAPVRLPVGFFFHEFTEQNIVVVGTPEKMDVEISAETDTTVLIDVRAKVPDAFLVKVADTVRLDKAVVAPYFAPQMEQYRVRTTLPIALGDMAEHSMSPFNLFVGKLVRSQVLVKRKDA